MADLAGVDAPAFLPGPPTRDDLRSGGIDLLAEPPTPLPRPGTDKLAVSLRTGARIQQLIGERKTDVLVAGPATSTSPVPAAARRDSIAL